MFGGETGPRRWAKGMPLEAAKAGRITVPIVREIRYVSLGFDPEIQKKPLEGLTLLTVRSGLRGHAARQGTYCTNDFRAIQSHGRDSA